MVADVWPAAFDVGERKKMVKIIAVTAASLVALVGLGYLLTTVAWQPIGDDFSVIGKGKPVLVLVRTIRLPAERRSIVSARSRMITIRCLISWWQI